MVAVRVMIVESDERLVKSRDDGADNGIRPASNGCPAYVRESSPVSSGDAANRKVPVVPETSQGVRFPKSLRKSGIVLVAVRETQGERVRQRMAHADQRNRRGRNDEPTGGKFALM